MGQVRLNYSISQETESDLSSYCELTGRTASDVVRQLICELLDGDRELPDTATIKERERAGPRRDQRTDMWVSPRILGVLDRKIEEEGYPSKSAVIAWLLRDFLASRLGDADEHIKVSTILDRQTFSAVRKLAEVRRRTVEDFIGELCKEAVAEGNDILQSNGAE